jgi:hypothetical protein
VLVDNVDEVGLFEGEKDDEGKGCADGDELGLEEVVGVLLGLVLVMVVFVVEDGDELGVEEVGFTDEGVEGVDNGDEVGLFEGEKDDDGSGCADGDELGLEEVVEVLLGLVLVMVVFVVEDGDELGLEEVGVVVDFGAKEVVLVD